MMSATIGRLPTSHYLDLAVEAIGHNLVTTNETNLPTLSWTNSGSLIVAGLHGRS